MPEPEEEPEEEQEEMIPAELVDCSGVNGPVAGDAVERSTASDGGENSADTGTVDKARKAAEDIVQLDMDEPSLFDEDALTLF